MANTQHRKRGKWFGYTEAASLGLEMAVAVAIGGIAGLYLERHVTHWSPWTSLLGLLLGIGAAANAVVRVARDLRARPRWDSDSAERRAPGARSTPEPRSSGPEETLDDRS